MVLVKKVMLILALAALGTGLPAQSTGTAASWLDAVWTPQPTAIAGHSFFVRGFESISYELYINEYLDASKIYRFWMVSNGWRVNASGRWSKIDERLARDPRRPGLYICPDARAAIYFMPGDTYRVYGVRIRVNGGE